MQDQQARVYHFAAVYRGVHNHINGFVERSICVEVFASAYSNTFSKIVYAMPGKILGSVKGHVLKKVCQSGLIVFLLHGANPLGDVKIGSFLGLFVVPDVIGQSIGQFAITYFRVDGKGLHLLLGCYWKDKSQQQQPD